MTSKDFAVEYEAKHNQDDGYNVVFENEEFLKKTRAQFVPWVKRATFLNKLDLFIHLITIPLLIGYMFGGDNYEWGKAFLILSISCIFYVMIKGQMRSDIDDLHSKELTKFLSDRVFNKTYRKTIKALKISDSQLKLKEAGNVYMSLAYVFRQNKVMYKSNDDIELIFNNFKRANPELNSLELAKCFYESAFKVYFKVMIERLSKKDLEVLDDYVEKNLKYNREKIEREEKHQQYLEKKKQKMEEKEKLKTLKGVSPKQLLNEQQKEERILAEDYVDRRYFN